MKRLDGTSWRVCALVAPLFLAGPVAAQVPAARTAVSPIVTPRVTGPVAVSADSYPMMAASRLQNVVDLRAAGYVEEEYLVSGRANVYDWGRDGRLTVRTAAAPYATRILVRRPSDPRRASGAAVVELANSGRRYDFSFTWAMSYRHFMEEGDTWVGLTYAPDVIDGLKAFNPKRYAGLSMANPTPSVRCGAAAPRASEEGLLWDIISQVGALLKAPPSAVPLATAGIRRVYATSHGGELPTYIAAVHPHARMSGGGSVYDGFLVHRQTPLSRINGCAAAPGTDDPRQILHHAGVPIIRIVSETDVLGTHMRRRDDSDVAEDRYRLYEVAGAPHADGAFYRHVPSVADQRAVGTEAFLAMWPFAEQCEPEIPLLDFPVMQYVMNAAFVHLDRWVRDGVPPPRAQRVTVAERGTSRARVEVDEFGNARGGVRSPYLDVPTATYYASTKGGGLCRNLGRKVSFDWSQLEQVYGTYQAYVAKRDSAVARLLGERWLTASDARRIREEPIVPALNLR